MKIGMKIKCTAIFCRGTGKFRFVVVSHIMGSADIILRYENGKVLRGDIMELILITPLS